MDTQNKILIGVLIVCVVILVSAKFIKDDGEKKCYGACEEEKYYWYPTYWDGESMIHDRIQITKECYHGGVGGAFMVDLEILEDIKSKCEVIDLNS